MKNKTFTFIGGGNMATALFTGLLANDIDPQQITVVEPNPEKRAQAHDVHLVKTLASVTAKSLDRNYVFLCVKPQLMQAVCVELAAMVSNTDTIFISIAAGITTSQLREWLQTENCVVRCMPNTPALLGLGATGLYSNDELIDTEKNNITTIFSSIGISIWVEQESDIDTVTAVSGSGPAYFFRMIEAMQAVAVELGLDEENAGRLITQTALGAAQMAKDSALSVQQLRENVTSEGGTTAAALNSFDENNFDHIIRQAVQSARTRSIELSQF